MIEFLKKIHSGREKWKNLTHEEAYKANKKILNQESTDIQTGAFWFSMRVKYSTVEELKGFIDALKEDTDFVNCEEFNPLDIAVGYDGKNRSLHILPSAIFIACGSGAKIVGHGSENVPSKYGTTYQEILKHMGCKNIDNQKDILKTLELSGFGFYHQKNFNPKLYALLPKRREFGLRNFLNTVEKIVNPFKTTKVLIGTAHNKFIDKYTQIAHYAGFKDIYVIKGLEGGIEPFPDRETKVCTNKIFSLKIIPKNKEYKIKFLQKLSPYENAEICLNLLKNQDGKFKDWAILTAGLLNYSYGIGNDIKDATQIAEKSLLSGAAYECFEIYKSLTS